MILLGGCLPELSKKILADLLAAYTGRGDGTIMHTENPSEDSEKENIEPLFDLGQIVGTPGALQAMQEAEQDPLELLVRHVTGDWGDLPDEDLAENELSVERGLRVFSSYKLNTGAKVWVITEWDRSVTTFLLPAEY